MQPPFVRPVIECMEIVLKCILFVFVMLCIIRKTFWLVTSRAVASLTVPSGRKFHFPHFFLKFWSIFLIFPQTLLNSSSFWPRILALQVGESPTRALATPLVTRQYLVAHLCKGWKDEANNLSFWHAADDIRPFGISIAHCRPAVVPKIQSPKPR